jgi:hypothetical protein
VRVGQGEAGEVDEGGAGGDRAHFEAPVAAVLASAVRVSERKPAAVLAADCSRSRRCRRRPSPGDTAL